MISREKMAELWHLHGGNVEAYTRAVIRFAAMRGMDIDDAVIVGEVEKTCSAPLDTGRHPEQNEDSSTGESQ